MQHHRPKSICTPARLDTGKGYHQEPLAKPTARARKAPERNHLKPVPAAIAARTTPALAAPVAPAPAEALPARPRLTREHARRQVVSTDTEFWNSHYCRSGEWAGCWCAHYGSVKRGSAIIHPDTRLYFRLYWRRPDSDEWLPLTDEDYASLDALLPAHTRAVWLSTIGQAAVNSAYRGVPLLGYRVTYRQIVEALINDPLFRHPVPADWKPFIDQQLNRLAQIGYRRRAETTNAVGGTVEFDQPTILPLVGFMRRSDDPDGIYIQESAALFWDINGLGRSRVLPVSVAFPRAPWSFCICAELLAKICRTPINGKADIRELFSPNACKAVREQYERSVRSCNMARDNRRLLDAVVRLLDSLVAVGTLKGYTVQNGVVAWHRGDHGASLSERGIYAHYLTMAAEQIASGEVGFRRR